MLCQASETEQFHWGEYHLNLLPPLGVARCRQCDLLFLSPRPDENSRQALLRGTVPEALQAYSHTKANYAAVTRSRSDLFERRLETLEHLVETDHHSLRILDVGASAGTFVEQARERGWDAFGVEASVDGTRVALEQGMQFPRGVAEALPFADGSFDVLHSHHVFEHLTDPLAAAREAWRVLKPGGLVFIEIPNQLDNIFFHRAMWFGRVPQRERNIRSIHHLFFFSRKTLAMLLRQAGFADVKVQEGYGRILEGWRAPLNLATRVVGSLAFGGPLVRAYGRKPEATARDRVR